MRLFRVETFFVLAAWLGTVSSSWAAFPAVYGNQSSYQSTFTPAQVSWCQNRTYTCGWIGSWYSTYPPSTNICEAMLDPSAGSPCGTSSPYCIELRLTNVPCSAPGSNVAFYISATPNTCPENATLSGTTCTCNTDFEENPAHNACIPKPVQQAEPEGTPGPQMCLSLIHI